MESVKTRDAYGLQIIKPQKSSKRKLKDDVNSPRLHGYQVWRSSYMLLDYLKHNPLVRNQRVMDIGCGWGVSGIYCAKHFAAEATLVDADDRVFSYVRHHEMINDVSVTTMHRSFKDLLHADFVEVDTVVGSDICFWPELLKDLKQLIGRALNAGIEKIILADPGRPNFMELADFCKQHHKSELRPWVFGGKTKREGYVLSVSAV